MPPLLSVEDLVTEFRAGGRSLRAVDRVSFDVGAGETVGVVGESGCGKSVTALSLLRLIAPPGQITGGKIVFKDRDLLTLDEPSMRALRGDRLAMIFQEPMTSLNPVYTVGNQVAEPLRIHRAMSRKAARAEARTLFHKVGIADPDRRIDAYPHELSGGMRQRVMIAMALACGPELLVADEPTTALDVTIQAQILDLLSRLSRELGMAVLLITHDLGVVAETCRRVVVMYAGQVVERATTRELFAFPRHPYSAGLLRSVPAFSPVAAPGDPTARAAAPRKRLPEIAGMVPRLDQLPPGCRFADRCDRVQARCRDEAPALRSLPTSGGDGATTATAFVRCHFPIETARSVT